MDGSADDVTSPRPQARPWRVAVLAGLLLVEGAGRLVLAGVAGGGPFGGLPPWTSALLGVVSFGLAWAVWQGRRWGWWSLVVLHGASGAYLLLLAASMSDAGAGRDLIWPAVYLVLLTSRRTRTYFGMA